MSAHGVGKLRHHKCGPSGRPNLFGQRPRGDVAGMSPGCRPIRRRSLPSPEERLWSG
jgi:hypothetical protein